VAEAIDRRYFFDAGLRFACRRCGACCTGAPGRVRASGPEAQAIAGLLGRPLTDLVPTLLIPDGQGFRVREHPDGRCVFYAAGCRIYPARPVQCRAYPFWFEILRTEAAWRREAARCPGIGEGNRYDREEILALLSRDRRLAESEEIAPETAEDDQPPMTIDR